MNILTHEIRFCKGNQPVGKRHRRSIRLKNYDYSQPGAYFVTMCTQNRACLFGNVVGGKMVLNDAGRMVEKWYFELENKFPDILCDEYIIMPNHFHAIIINAGTDLRVCPDYIINPDNMAGSNNMGGADHMSGHNKMADPKQIAGADKMGIHDNIGGRKQMGKHKQMTDPDHMGIHDNVGGRKQMGKHKQMTDPDHMGIHDNVGGRKQMTDPDHTGIHDNVGEHDKNQRGEHTGSPLRRVVQWFKTMTTNEYIRGVKQNRWQPFPGKLWQRNYYEHIIRNENELNRIRHYIKNNPAHWERDKHYAGLKNYRFHKRQILH